MLIALIFLLIVLYIAYDISQRTTFPGQEPAGAEEVEQTEEAYE